jgi:hypothetical protein
MAHQAMRDFQSMCFSDRGKSGRIHRGPLTTHALGTELIYDFVAMCSPPPGIHATRIDEWKHLPLYSHRYQDSPIVYPYSPCPGNSAHFLQEEWAKRSRPTAPSEPGARWKK